MVENPSPGRDDGMGESFPNQIWRFEISLQDNTRVGLFQGMYDALGDEASFLEPAFNLMSPTDWIDRDCQFWFTPTGLLKNMYALDLVIGALEHRNCGLVMAELNTNPEWDYMVVYWDENQIAFDTAQFQGIADEARYETMDREGLRRVANTIMRSRGQAGISTEQDIERQEEESR